jgi:hypothetical protein
MTARAALLVLAVAAAVLLAAPPAGALPILELADAEELVQALAEATEEQDICYGWSVTVHDNTFGGNSGTDFGSSLGLGRLPEGPECPRYVLFEATVSYTSESSESEDAAYYRVDSNVARAPTEDDLRRVGVSGEGLLGEQDDVALTNAVLALPALVAEQGLAPAIDLEANTDALPAGDRATGTPGSDWLRQYGSTLALLALVVLGGFGWAAWILVHERPFDGRRSGRRALRSVGSSDPHSTDG